jgi:hypothetical protein
MTYDPLNHDDPLRHRYLERAERSTFSIPLADKVSAGLGQPGSLSSVAFGAAKKEPAKQLGASVIAKLSFLKGRA